MEVKLQIGDSVQVPFGSKVSINGNTITIEKNECGIENIENKFNDGDIIIDGDIHSSEGYAIAILKGEFNVGSFFTYAEIDYDGIFSVESNEKWDVNANDWRLATIGEQNILLDELERKGLRWNAKEKRIEKVKWRAAIGEQYFFISDAIDICITKDNRTAINNLHYDSGNYFQSHNEAMKVVERMREIFGTNH